MFSELSMNFDHYINLLDFINYDQRLINNISIHFFFKLINLINFNNKKI